MRRFLLSTTASVVLGATLALAAIPSPEELVKLRVEGADIAAEDQLRVTVTAEIAAGWHVNAHLPSAPELIATVLTVEPGAGWQVGEIEYPRGEDMAFAFAGGETVRVYSGKVPMVVPISPPPGFAGREVSFRAKLRYQACDDERCLRPADAERDFLVRVASPEAAVEPAAVPPATNVAPVDRWLAERGLATTLGLVFLLGLGLNLTPCVYPLVSVTLAYFGGQSDAGRGRLLGLAAAFATGIVGSFATLGVVAALSGGIFGAALTSPIVLGGVSLLLTLLALSNFGVWTMRLPSALTQRAGSAAAGVAGALFMGLTMGIVAAPCVGPIVVGLLLAVASRADVAFGALAFSVLGAGLAGPYVLLALAAGSISRLPRAGEWLLWVEHLFGFVLLGLALWFASPLLPAGAAALAAPILFATAGVWLGILGPKAGSTPGFRWIRLATGSAAVALAVWTVWPAKTATASVRWQPFSEARLAAAREQGLPAIVDFRADWCLPCVEMEQTTFIAEEVVRRASGFVALQADITEATGEAEELTAKYQVLGVPTTIFFDAAGNEARRMVGYVSAEEFARILDETASGRGRAVVPSDRSTATYSSALVTARFVDPPRDTARVSLVVAPRGGHDDLRTTSPYFCPRVLGRPRPEGADANWRRALALSRRRARAQALASAPCVPAPETCPAPGQRARGRGPVREPSLHRARARCLPAWHRPGAGSGFADERRRDESSRPLRGVPPRRGAEQPCCRSVRRTARRRTSPTRAGRCHRDERCGSG